MIQKLCIKNYKSLKSVDLDCKKLNVFIGEPNSGKSNIIEALSLLSPGVMRIGNKVLKDVVRYKTMGDLFFDFNINKPIEIVVDRTRYTLEYAKLKENTIANNFNFQIQHPDGRISLDETIMIDHNGTVSGSKQVVLGDFRYYEYKRLMEFLPQFTPYLLSPNGDNLPTLLLSNEEYRRWVEEFFESKGFLLTLKPAENEISMSKMVNKSIYSYPYYAISETLQRVVFYMMAVKSNQEAVLLFDEPDSNTFPFYTGFMGERIALDETNQFFITTHNPYLLLGLIEKSKVTDINVCVVSMQDYETKVTVLTETQISEVLDLNADVFLNLDRIIDK